jgi:hypothetical protein
MQLFILSPFVFTTCFDYVAQGTRFTTEALCCFLNSEIQYIKHMKIKRITELGTITILFVTLLLLAFRHEIQCR